MAPRQRPKGGAQPSHNLPLVAPPSPSPRNTLSSPVPPPPTLSAAMSTSTGDAPVVETFAAQFQANFPQVAVPPAPVPTPQSQQQPTTPSIASQPPTTPLVQPSQTTNSLPPISQPDSEQIEKLFDSNFPDPFRESAHSLTGSGTLFTQQQVVQQSETRGSKQDIVMPLDIVAGTPTKSVQQLLNASKPVVSQQPNVGHRRNMSDTSAFNKSVSRLPVYSPSCNRK